MVFPITEREKWDWEAADRLLADSCAANAGPIMNHMSTANVARDLDLLRRSVGDRKLNYMGFSYGSYLGTTYANMFPGTVGAFVVDGVLDPIAWSTGSGNQSVRLPFTTRIRSDAGSERALKQFFTLCDLAEDNCAFSPHSRSRYEALLARLRVNPLEPFPGIVFGYRPLLAQTSGTLYTPANWTHFAELLADYEAASTAPAAAQESLTSSGAAAALGAAGTADYTPWEGLLAVACLDTDNPPTYAAWNRTANVVAGRYPHFGRLWVWENSSACHFWPGTDSDRYTGPWNKKTANPVLVVGNYYDPSTRYEGAVTVSRLLPGARLLSYAGWGHKASIIAGNDCMQNAITRYLVWNELPPRGTVCQPTGSPFDTQPEDPATLPLTPLEIPDSPSWTIPGN
jgi:pimeloyl-ACP methyl ester carboxylesterase